MLKKISLATAGEALPQSGQINPFISKVYIPKKAGMSGNFQTNMTAPSLKISRVVI